MLVWNGLIGKRFESFREDDSAIVFASGVSNSSNTDPSCFQREKDLLQKHLSDSEGRLFVYFSSCSITDPAMSGSAYVRHKLEIEETIRSAASKYLIVRTSNPVGFTDNTHTLLNFLFRKILSGERFSVWGKSRRNLIDMDDLYGITTSAMADGAFENSIVNVASPVDFPVTEIVRSLEEFLGKSGNFEVVDKGGSPIIDTAPIAPLIERLGMSFDSNYLGQMISKYYTKSQVDRILEI